MNLSEPTADNVPPISNLDALTQWALRVARRADDLARTTASGRDHDLESWLQAEREMLVDFPANGATTVS